MANRPYILVYKDPSKNLPFGIYFDLKVTINYTFLSIATTNCIFIQKIIIKRRFNADFPKRKGWTFCQISDFCCVFSVVFGAFTGKILETPVNKPRG